MHSFHGWPVTGKKRIVVSEESTSLRQTAVQPNLPAIFIHGMNRIAMLAIESKTRVQNFSESTSG